MLEGTPSYQDPKEDEAMILDKLIKYFKRNHAPEGTHFRVVHFAEDYYALEVSENGRWLVVTESLWSPREWQPERSFDVIDEDFEKLKQMAVVFKNNPEAYEAYIKSEDAKHMENMKEWRALQNKKKKYFEV